ncbi:peptide deformylase [Corynebacterium sphenisci]|uniref:peptide deformylase n=1 Tax=Corynebacterium sphenisci TaxID=191493 RepID=UPI0026E07B1E|nr:peptide deformylase [Corynebacterium sphenisci]MDO5730208.1 peptide deformylase [Corynebacterium sphenisci]
MAIRDIRLFGDPALTSRAEEITVFDERLDRLAGDLLDTMDAGGGVGLAANQIGVLRRVFAYDCDGRRGVLVNPRWEPVGEDTVVEEEGCLSIPGVAADAERYARVRATGQDPSGTPVRIEAAGLLARCIQHEADHLDGVLFLRRLEPAARRAAMARVRAMDWFRNGR